MTTPAPMPPASSVQYPPNLVALVHEAEWMDKGELKVLAVRGSFGTVESFTFKDFAQVFAIDGMGAIRVLEGQGNFVQVGAGCDFAAAGPAPRAWQFTPRQLPRSYSMETRCAAGDRRLGYDPLVHPTLAVATTATGSSSGWFVVPVARIA
jgi:hypothetical protein